MKILGIETSCDETAAAIVEKREGQIFVLSNIIASQIKEHEIYGGVVPEIAARSHVEKIEIVIKSALSKSAEPLLRQAAQSIHCQVEGIYSQFASSDSPDLGYAREQLARFQQVLMLAEGVGLRPRYRHIANSGAIVQLPESYLDIVRPGLLFYGVYPDERLPQTVVVAPALTWKSRVVYFKVVQPGHPVSYGSTWQADHPVRIVTVPVGYGDGDFRALSGKTEVIVRGRRYPVVGRICMDQMISFGRGQHRHQPVDLVVDDPIG